MLSTIVSSLDAHNNHDVQSSDGIDTLAFAGEKFYTDDR